MVDCCCADSQMAFTQGRKAHQNVSIRFPNVQLQTAQVCICWAKTGAKRTVAAICLWLILLLHWFTALVTRHHVQVLSHKLHASPGRWAHRRCMIYYIREYISKIRWKLATSADFVLKTTLTSLTWISTMWKCIKHKKRSILCISFGSFEVFGCLNERKAAGQARMSNKITSTQTNENFPNVIFTS